MFFIKLILILLFLFLVEKLYFQLADRYNIIDKPNHRSSHSQITLRGGGIIFTISILLENLLYGVNYPWFLCGLLLITLISFIDDIKPQRASLRLLFHFVAMFTLFIQLDLFSLSWWYVPLALILFVGILNIYNFMDGINGITGGYSLVVLGVLNYVNSCQIHFLADELFYFILLGLVVFLFFNFRIKAKCFAGDVGSISIAFIILFALGALLLQSENFTYLIFIMVYGVDAGLTILHRIMLGENITQPHRKHLYQLLANELQIKHIVVSLIYMITQLVLSIIFLSFPNYQLEIFILSLIILSSCYILLKRKYFHLHLQKK